MTAEPNALRYHAISGADPNRNYIFIQNDSPASSYRLQTTHQFSLRRQLFMHEMLI